MNLHEQPIGPSLLTKRVHGYANNSSFMLRDVAGDHVLSVKTTVTSKIKHSAKRVFRTI